MLEEIRPEKKKDDLDVYTVLLSMLLFGVVIWLLRVQIHG